MHLFIIEHDKYEIKNVHCIRKKIEYLRWDQEKLFNEKKNTQKSCDTVPLSNILQPLKLYVPLYNVANSLCFVSTREKVYF